MKEREELIRYISNLTEADMKKIIQRLPELISKLEAQGLPVHRLTRAAFNGASCSGRKLLESLSNSPAAPAYAPRRDGVHQNRP